MAPTATDFDAVTIDQLRAVGGVKWSTFPDAIGAFVAEMDFGTAPVVTAALHRAVDDALLGYLPAAHTDAMAQAFTAFAAERYGWAVDPERVRPLPDVLAAFQATIEHFSRPGSPVIVPTPAYMPFLTLPGALGRDVLEVPLTRDGDRYVYDLDALDAAFAAGGHVLALCNPHNPVGRVLERAELAAIAEVVERHGGRVFADEIHAPLVYAGHAHVPYASLSPATAAHTLTATSASKAFNVPGLKCAQLILSNDADAERWREVGPWLEHPTATPGVVAATAGYTDGGPWLDAVVDYLDGNRRRFGELVAELLPGVRYTAPEGTYLGWLDVRDLALGDRPADVFRERAGVAMTDGAACGRAGTGFLRFTLAMPRPLLEQAVHQMGAALERR